MDLDWFEEQDFIDTKQFNENSIISKEKKKEIDIEIKDTFDEEIKLENCFNINLKVVTDQTQLLNILNYLSLISNNLRTFIRNKSSKFNDSLIITDIEYEMILNYLNWLKNALLSIKDFFAASLRRDNSFDPNNIKLFKTSSYKFCNYKELCSIHRNKNKICDKNHYVFEMIINDIDKLIDSINLLGLENINWVVNNKYLHITFCIKEKTYQINKINSHSIADITQNENKFIVDKNTIFKSFDVISYVLTKMYEESYYFLNNNNNSLLIKI